LPGRAERYLYKTIVFEPGINWKNIQACLLETGRVVSIMVIIDKYTWVPTSNPIQLFGPPYILSSRIVADHIILSYESHPGIIGLVCIFR